MEVGWLDIHQSCLSNCQLCFSNGKQQTCPGIHGTISKCLSISTSWTHTQTHEPDNIFASPSTNMPLAATVQCNTRESRQGRRAAKWRQGIIQLICARQKVVSCCVEYKETIFIALKWGSARDSVKANPYYPKSCIYGMFKISTFLRIKIESSVS